MTEMERITVEVVFDAPLGTKDDMDNVGDEVEDVEFALARVRDGQHVCVNVTSEEV